MNDLKLSSITERVAKGFIVFFYMCLAFFTIVACQKDDDVEQIGDVNSEVFNTSFEFKNSQIFLSYDDALDISSSLISAANLFFDESNNPSLPNNEKDLVQKFWSENDFILTDVSSDLKLREAFVKDDFSQLNNLDYNVSIINDLDFFSQIQKAYAIELMTAAQNNDFVELVNIKNRFKSDLNKNPDLALFNIGIALIESVEIENNNFLAKDDDCMYSIIYGAIISGVIGMVLGAIGGGLSGVVLGFGLLSVPAGGAGAVIGAVFGGLGGFVTGYAAGWLYCKLFG